MVWIAVMVPLRELDGARPARGTTDSPDPHREHLSLIVAQEGPDLETLSFEVDDVFGESRSPRASTELPFSKPLSGTVLRRLRTPFEAGGNPVCRAEVEVRRNPPAEARPPNRRLLGLPPPTRPGVGWISTSTGSSGTSVPPFWSQGSVRSIGRASHTSTARPFSAGCSIDNAGAFAA
jgi:hypothetical protein